MILNVQSSGKETARWNTIHQFTNKIQIRCSKVKHNLSVHFVYDITSEYAWRELRNTETEWTGQVEIRRQNSWQKTKHKKLYSGLLLAKQREVSRGAVNLCVRKQPTARGIRESMESIPEMGAYTISPTALCWKLLTLHPQWGAADAEIKVPSGENTELKRSPFQAWSRSVYSHTCYAYCQRFLPCLFLPFRSIHLHFFQNLSRFSPVLAVANTLFLCRPAE